LTLPIFNSQPRLRSRLSAALVCVAVSIFAVTPVVGEVDPLDAPLEVVRFGEEDTIRGLVGKYLSDPDLWPTVLALNGIASPAELVPGIELLLPVKQVFAADSALVASLEAIQRANAEGARIFAPSEIGLAIESRDAAISQREVGEWRQVVNYAGVAEDFANEALDISIALRDRSAEAIVSDVQGAVEGRSPAEQRWSNRQLDDILVEFERLRTLSDSTTQITFRDLSRLRLNPNSNATIQRMRSDPLTGGEVTKVSLVNGDFYALLNQLSDKSTFEIDVPGIETTTNSADFWIKNDQSGARFVNYDTPDLNITRDGEAITLKENEGVVISGQGTERTEILDSPLLSAPSVGQVIYTAATALSWQAFDGAAAYWLEVALDPGFNQMQISEWGIRETGFEAADLPPSRYHWRVAALDQLGLPGEWSTPRDFTVRVDATPPFLTLLSPASGTITTQPQVEVLGATEPDSVLALNGATLETGRDGSFLASVALVPGQNTVTVTATDPAGNQSTRNQTVIYRAVEDVAITLAASIPRVGDALAARSEQLSVSAATTADPGAAVAVRDASGAVVVQTLIGEGGALGFTVPVDEAARAYRIEVLSPLGAVEGSIEFTALRDATAPLITLDIPPPRATGEAFVGLAGGADDAVRLELNGTLLPLVDGRFDLTLELEPGENDFDLVATDAVGNVSVTRLSSVLDIDPPEVIRVELSRPEGNSGPIEIIAEATDASGLVQAAPFVISIGGIEVDGFLRCDSASGICRASLPPQPGALELIELVVEDYAGNAAFE